MYYVFHGPRIPAIKGNNTNRKNNMDRCDATTDILMEILDDYWEVHIDIYIKPDTKSLIERNLNGHNLFDAAKNRSDCSSPWNNSFMSQKSDTKSPIERNAIGHNLYPAARNWSDCSSMYNKLFVNQKPDTKSLIQRNTIGNNFHCEARNLSDYRSPCNNSFMSQKPDTKPPIGHNYIAHNLYPAQMMWFVKN